MKIFNTPNSYGLAHLILHWTGAGLVIGLFALGLYMTELDYYDNWYHAAPWWHKSFGTLALFLFGARFLWRLINPVPEPQGKKWEVRSAKITHLLFYVLVLSAGVSGYLLATAKGEAVEVFNFFAINAWLSTGEPQEKIAASMHEILAYALIALAVIHAFAGLKHHFIDKDNTLRRIFFGE